MIKFKHHGDFEKTEAFFNRIRDGKYLTGVELYAQMGVDALKAYTPVRTGKTRASWRYEIERGKNTTKIIWINDNLNKDGTPIILLLQYGHVTENGHYIEGRDIINPAIQPIFDEIEKLAWAEVTMHK